MPKYLIKFKNDPKTIMIVECKAVEKFHESKDRNKSKLFSVDGALWCTKRLKSSYNVIAVAISGKTANKCRVSIFNWFKGQERPIEISKMRDAIVHPSNYLKLLLGDEEMKSDFSIDKGGMIPLSLSVIHDSSISPTLALY